MAAHAILGASSMGIWSRCAAMPRFVQNMPDSKSVYAAEGSVAHGIGEALARGEKPPVVGEIVESDGFHVTVDQDMLDHAASYNALLARLSEGVPKSDIMIEVRMSLEAFASS